MGRPAPHRGPLPGACRPDPGPRNRSFVVAVVTYRRPAELRRLLHSFADLGWPASWCFTGVLVVDNDPDGSAGPVVEDLRGRFPWPLRYVIETRPGVAAARNRAVAAAGDVTHVAMIDDDEVIGAGWPHGLLALAERTGADLTGGEPVPQPEVDVPAWMLRPLAFGHETHPDGAAVTRLAAGNLLIDRALLDRYDPLFDERFGRTGGEDSYLSAVVVDGGGQLRWSATSPTFEILPAERCTAAWLRQRWRRNGATMTLVQLALAPTRRRRAYLRVRALIIGVARIAVGTSAVLAPLSDDAAAFAVRQRSQGRGQVACALGRVPLAYGPGGFESPG